MSKSLKILGIACSLRNARWGFGSDHLINSLAQIKTIDQLNVFLEKESNLHLENFMNAGRREGQDFSEIYRNLKKKKGTTGLSNSEVMLAASLWSAQCLNVEIEHLSLVEYFATDGTIKNREELIQKLLTADALLISGPVYFGDRGSLAESLIDFIRLNPEVQEHLKGKPYAGLSVGAKRNGGQETALVYQMFDMLDLGMLAIGNDSETTAQYGGTGHAGDVGTMHLDDYGLKTAMGTGRRLAHVLRLLNTQGALKAKLKTLVIIMRESELLAQKTLVMIKEALQNYTDFTIINATEHNIHRCIACDICPTHIDQDSVYRCIIKSKRDDLQSLHHELLSHDVIIPIVADGHNTDQIKSNYQQLIERTRYLRRGDYVLGDQLVVPILASELGSKSTYLLRLTTSFVRHHTVLSKPLEVIYHNQNALTDIKAQLLSSIESARQLTIGRLQLAIEELNSQVDDTLDRRYNPVGYVLSAHKAKEDEHINAREVLVSDRVTRIAAEARQRLGFKVSHEP